MQVEIKRLHPDACIPTYKTPGAAGMDLHARLDAPVSVPAGKTVFIPTGVAIYIRDPGVACILLPRSGLGAKDGLVLGNLVGLLDSDYQGEYMVAAWNRNQGGEPITIKPGDRIAQAAFVPVIQVTTNEVSEFTAETDRGTGGFGSTGVATADIPMALLPETCLGRATFEHYVGIVANEARQQGRVLAYCDGGSRGNGSAGARAGWGGVLACPNGVVFGTYGGALGATNNQMELRAAIEALERVLALEPCHAGGKVLEIFADSEYVKKGITEWISGWKRRNWRTSGGDAVKNQPLWQALDAACASVVAAGWQMKWSWTRGHSGNPGNELADALANLGCDNPAAVCPRTMLNATL